MVNTDLVVTTRLILLTWAKPEAAVVLGTVLTSHMTLASKRCFPTLYCGGVRLLARTCQPAVATGLWCIRCWAGVEFLFIIRITVLTGRKCRSGVGSASQVSTVVGRDETNDKGKGMKGPARLPQGSGEQSREHLPRDNKSQTGSAELTFCRTECCT